MTNTCPLDNWLMIFQALVESNRINLADFKETGNIIGKSLQLVEIHQYGDAKVAILPPIPKIRSNIISLYGNESDVFVKHLLPYMQSTTTSTCILDTCPFPTHTLNTSSVILNLPSEQNRDYRSVIVGSLYKFSHPINSEYKQRFPNQPPHDIPYYEDVTLDTNLEKTESWHCSGVREWSEWSLTNLQNVFFSVDLLSRNGQLKLSQVPLYVTLCKKKFTFHSATLWNGTYYICTFSFNGGWFMYDGMKECSEKNLGLSYSDTLFEEPCGYSLSYLIYCQ